MILEISNVVIHGADTATGATNRIVAVLTKNPVER